MNIKKKVPNQSTVSPNLRAQTSFLRENTNDAEFKRRKLRDAVICIGWLKLLSVSFYACLFFAVHLESDGQFCLILQGMTLVAIPVQLVTGIMLFLGAIEAQYLGHSRPDSLPVWLRIRPYALAGQIFLRVATATYLMFIYFLFPSLLPREFALRIERITALDISLWLCLAIASYNTVLGTVGCIYFIRFGYSTIHLVVAVFFAILVVSLFSAICHDILIIYAYKQSITYSDDRPLSGTEPIVV